MVRSCLVLSLLQTEGFFFFFFCVSGELMCDQAVSESMLRFNNIITNATNLSKDV